jgi:hypothetical protein
VRPCTHFHPHCFALANAATRIAAASNLDDYRAARINDSNRMTVLAPLHFLIRNISFHIHSRGDNHVIGGPTDRQASYRGLGCQKRDLLRGYCLQRQYEIDPLRSSRHWIGQRRLGSA